MELLEIRAGFILRLKECTFDGLILSILLNCHFVFSKLILKVSFLLPSTISWKTIPEVICIEPRLAALSILQSKISHHKIVATYERTGNE